MKVMTWVLGAVLTAAPAMYAQNAQDQPTQPQTPAATQNSTDQGSMTPASDQGTIYGTGMTAAELKQIGYTDDEIAQMRNDSQAMMASAQPNGAMPQSDQASQTANASNPNAGTMPQQSAQNNNAQAPNAANGVSNPGDMNTNSNAANQPQKAETNNHAGLWGLLGLLGLLGLAGRAKRQAVVHHDVDTVRDRDRMRTVAERDDVNRAAREREIRDREVVAARDYRDQDIMSEQERARIAENEVQRNLRDREVRDQRVREMREEDRNRRRTA